VDSSFASDGVFVVDKPAGWTSHDVVARLRKIAGTKRVGHLGTLDPMATGVLPIVVNRATRLAQFYVKNEKVYEGVIRFGQATDTYDADGTPTGEPQPATLDAAALERLLDSFRGTFLQTPPPVSAKKIGGKKAYEFARQNVAVDLKPVEVTVFALDLLELHGADALVRVHCSGGTYLRGIAHDLGIAAGCGAHLASLRRIASGDFTLDTAHTLEQLAELAQQNRLSQALIPAANLLPTFPTEVVDSVTATQIRQGRDFRVSPFKVRGPAPFVKAVSSDGQLLAIGEARLPLIYHPKLVF
jgi:tRNA pseudouridine55 synthase